MPDVPAAATAQPGGLGGQGRSRGRRSGLRRAAASYSAIRYGHLARCSAGSHESTTSRLPRVNRRGVALPQHQVVCPVADRLAFRSCSSAPPRTPLPGSVTGPGEGPGPSDASRA